MYVQRDIPACSRNHRGRGKAVLYIFCECARVGACVWVGIQERGRVHVRL